MMNLANVINISGSYDLDDYATNCNDNNGGVSCLQNTTIGNMDTIQNSMVYDLLFNSK